ncbi:MAG: c-type cytochrome [Proteobacteria bacterium]|nr:c-type cytochrome [Pseudomonadota bacterium]
MRRLIIAALLATTFAPALVWAWPWSQDMMNQPSVKPQEPARGGKMMPFPHRSIPVQGIPTQVADREAAKTLINPIPATPESIKKGRTLFRIICSACHGLTGMADSPVSDKIGAIPLTDDYVQKQLSEGWIFGTITFGGAVMPAYGVTGGQVGSNDLSVDERWHVVNYVRRALVNEPAPVTQQAKTP